MVEERQRTDGGEDGVCFRCLAVNGGAGAFCRECGAPVGGSATLDPVQTIRAQGFIYRRVLEGRPKLIVLVGVWILHLPVLAVGVFMSIYLARNLRELSDLVFFWIMVALSAYALYVLLRVTKNYLTLPKE